MTAKFEDQGWIVLRNGPDSDFGVDLSTFKRSDERLVLPYALSVQVKSVGRARRAEDGAVPVRVRASTLASWLWSNTPTVCVVYERSSGRMWWSAPRASSGVCLDRDTKSRTLLIDAALDSAEDWARLDAQAVGLWTHHEGAAAIMDVPLVLQVLTDVALHTELWTSAGEMADSVYHAAAVHTYRTVAALNALAGRTGSDAFAELAEAAAEQVGVSWSHSLVSRGDTTLGVVSGIELRPWSSYLLTVFAQSGAELAATVPRLQQLARMPELGIPADLGAMLGRITAHQLAIVDSNRAQALSPQDFAQISDRPVDNFPTTPELDNQVPRPLARATPAALRALLR